MAKENRSRFAVLGMLHYGEMTGYEIRKRLQEMVGYFWQEPNASIYPTLKGLEKEGCVTFVREQSSRGPARVRYSLTMKGREVFGAWMLLEPAPTVMRNEFALKLLFGNLTTVPTILGFIRGELQTAQAVTESLNATMDRLPSGDDALLWRLIADYGRTIAQSTAQWCQRARAVLETPNVVMVPGWQDSDDQHWQTLWQEQLPESRRFRPRSWDAPSRTDWVSALTKEVEESSRPVVLVAHSLGCCTVLHAAAEGKLSKVVGAFLVALPDADRADFPSAIEGFSPLPRQRLEFPTLLVTSDDDPYMDPDTSRTWATTLGAVHHAVGNRGHLGSQADLGPWSEGRHLFEDFLLSLTSR